MSVSIVRPAEITPALSVVLTPQAFGKAQEANITAIEPDYDAMRAIGEVTATGQDWLPDITVIREHRPLGQHDINFNTARPTAPYFLASELAVRERSLQVVTASGLRRHLGDTGKKLVELTVRDWDGLGEILAEAILNTRMSGNGQEQVLDRVTDALSWFVSQVIHEPMLESPNRRKIQAARGIRPYTITRGRT
ncbi:MAG TPA: hypothetical protein VGO07_01835 [Candidatus Saccharimonadales bacterium]|jgi:hypothetical protein|nr:hypothetical protein [Candidatus Saccharimonadales bacterium]